MYLKKKTTLLLLIGSLSVLSLVQAQKEASFHFGLVYPVSTNGFNAAQTSNGASIHLLGGVSNDEKFFIVSGLTSVIKNNAHGFQLAGLSNHINNEGSGIAIAGLININKKSYSGLLFSGLINIGGNIKGIQFASLLNTAKSVKGIQVSGFINIAENNDTPIGLLNFITNGEKSISLFYDYLESTSITFKSGGKNTYGVFGFGYNQKVERIFSEVGFGANLYLIEKLRLRNEITIHPFITINKFNLENKMFKVKYSLIPSFKLTENLELFASGILEYISSKDDLYDKLLLENELWKKNNEDTKQQIQIGFAGGINFIF